jgi:hypothetical protein
MERLRYRSTSTIDLMAELRQRDLLAEARRLSDERRLPVRLRAGRIRLPRLGRRRTG